MEIAVGQSELGAVAWWAFGIGGRRRSVRPYGGICVLHACWLTCSVFGNERLQCAK